MNLDIEINILHIKGFFGYFKSHSNHKQKHLATLYTGAHSVYIS